MISFKNAGSTTSTRISLPIIIQKSDGGFNYGEAGQTETEQDIVEQAEDAQEAEQPIAQPAPAPPSAMAPGLDIPNVQRQGFVDLLYEYWIRVTFVDRGMGLKIDGIRDPLSVLELMFPYFDAWTQSSYPDNPKNWPSTWSES